MTTTLLGFTLATSLGIVAERPVLEILRSKTPSETCNLGGWLDENGHCQCFPTYIGSKCAQLALEPAVTSEALYRTDSSSWGGSVASDPATGTLHMFFADMLHNCGLDSWECNSAVSHATSVSGPEGPYRVTESSLVPPFAHNPTLVVLNNTWIVYHIGKGSPEKPVIGNCTGGQTGTAVCGSLDRSIEVPMAVSGETNQPNILFSTEGPTGKWESVQGDSSWSLNNPTVWLFPNGTALAVYKVGCNSTISPDPKTFCRQFALATAASWRGPFTTLGTIELFGEDAHIWKCPYSGTFRMLFQGGSYTKALPQWPGHFHMAYSTDGISDWRIAGHASPNFTDTTAFGSYVNLTNGSSITYKRRERHQVLLNKNGEPTHLFNGASGGVARPNSDQTLTIVQPLKTSETWSWR